MTLHEFSYTHEDLICELEPKPENGIPNDLRATDKGSASVHESLTNGTEKSPPSTKLNVDVTAKDFPECDGNSLVIQKKNFDETLRTLWDEAREKGLFRYKLHELPHKILQGKFQFIAQLNPDRAAKRRKPQRILSPNEPFNPDEFNFNKAKEEEFLMKWKPWWSQSQAKDLPPNSDTYFNCSNNTDNPLILDAVAKDEKRSERNNGEEIGHFILINVSPLEYGHVLLTPFLKQNQPQKITFDGLRMAVEMVLLNTSRDFRVGFNSLCGYASVNHHHYHAYYLKHRLYIEYAELHSVRGPCKEIRNFPAAGFAFVLLGVDIGSLENFIGNAFRLVTYLQETNVAHNIFITRGSSQSAQNTFNALRLFIWARESSFGSKECEAFNPALCELGGHFPIKNERSYEILTEEFVSHELELICRETFTNIRQAVATLYDDHDGVNDFPLQSSVK